MLQGTTAVTGQSYQVVVGGGGAGVYNNYDSNGGNSSFAGLTAIGGGGLGAMAQTPTIME